jgi:hypothetical protein
MLLLLTSHPAAQTTTQQPLAPDTRKPLAAEKVDLDYILARMQANVIEYRSSVPSFLCSEHVLSDVRRIVLNQSSLRSSTITDSTFRLRRAIGADHKPHFEEARFIQAVNGKPVASNETRITGPAIVSGVFANGINFVSQESRTCFSYHLHPRHRGTQQILIDFKDLPPNERAADCSPYEHGSGRASIDPVTMRVLRLDRHVPSRELLPGIFGRWDWTVEYALVPLGYRMFWLPKTIRSSAEDVSGTIDWRFIADYTDYHKLEGDAVIVPGTIKTVPATQGSQGSQESQDPSLESVPIPAPSIEPPPPSAPHS